MPGFVGVHRNPWRWRAVVQQQEVRHSTAGCLLSLLLFAPLFVRQYGLCAVTAVCSVYAVLVVPSAAGYFSVTALITRTARLLHRASSPAGARRPRAVPLPLLALLLGLPFVVLLLREHPGALLTVGASYCLLVVPLALRGQLPTSLSGPGAGLRAVWCAALQLPCTLYAALCHCAVAVLALLQTALVLPLHCVLHAVQLCSRAAAALHCTLLHSTAAQRPLQQLLFFVHLEHLLLPATQLHLTALVHLLSYNICLYVCSRLSPSGWATAHRSQSATTSRSAYTPASQSVTANRSAYTPASQSAAANASSFTAAKLGKAVVLSLVLNASWSRYVQYNVYYSMLCAVYFLLTVQQYTPSSWLAQQLGLEGDEEVVPFVVTAAAPLASLALLGAYVGCCLWRPEGCVSTPDGASWRVQAGLLLTLYCNVGLPLQRLLQEDAWVLLGGVLWSYRRASVQDCRRQGTCAVCLEPLRGGRVTPCDHVYHGACLRQLIGSGHTRCPLCNAALSR